MATMSTFSPPLLRMSGAAVRDARLVKRSRARTFGTRHAFSLPLDGSHPFPAFVAPEP